MQILTALHSKLLKIITVKGKQSNYNRKGSLEIAKVLKDSGEGRLFLLQAGAGPSTTLRMTAIKKAVLEPLAGAVAEGLFYINDIITSSQKLRKQYKSFVMNYNTQLCNTAWGKKLLAQVAKRTCFF